MSRLRAWLKQQYGTYGKLINMAIVTSVANLGYGIFNQSAIPPYVAAVGLTAYIGIIYASFAITETLFKTPMGSLEDIVGMRPVYVFAAALGAVSAYLWTLTANLWILLIIRFIDGAASAGIWTASIVAMGVAVGSRERTTAMGAFTFTYLGGLALGPLIGGYSNDVTHSTLTSFYVSAALFVVAGIMAYYMIPGRESQPQAPMPGKGSNLLSEIWLGLRALPDYMIIAFLAFFSFGLLIPIIKLFAMEQIGMTETEYGLITVPVALVLAVATLGSGRLASLWGKDRSVHIGIGMGALFMYLVPLIHHTWEFGVLAGLIGLGFVIGMPPWLALVSDMAAPEVRGAVIGALGTGQGVGLIVGLFLGGYFYSFVPFHFLGIHLDAHYTPFIASALGLTLTFVLSLIFVREGTERCITREGSKAD